MKIEDEIRQKAFKAKPTKRRSILFLRPVGCNSKADCRLSHFGITLPQFNVLRILRGQYPKPATVNLLIERMMDKTFNASRIVDKLEAQRIGFAEAMSQ